MRRLQHAPSNIFMLCATVLSFAPRTVPPVARRPLRAHATAEPLWDEEREQLEHLRQAALRATQLDELKALASRQAPRDGEEAAGDEMWAEEAESLEMLRELAAWDDRVSALRSLARNASRSRLGSSPEILQRHGETSRFTSSPETAAARRDDRLGSPPEMLRRHSGNTYM